MFHHIYIPQVTESHADPETTLLSFLRENRILQRHIKYAFNCPHLN